MVCTRFYYCPIGVLTNEVDICNLRNARNSRFVAFQMILWLLTTTDRKKCDVIAQTFRRHTKGKKIYQFYTWLLCLAPFRLYALSSKVSGWKKRENRNDEKKHDGMSTQEIQRKRCTTTKRTIVTKIRIQKSVVHFIGCPCTFSILNWILVNWIIWSECSGYVRSHLDLLSSGRLVRICK